MPINIELDYVAQPRQELLHSTAARQILYGGAAGGGKSHSLRWDAIDLCLNNPGLQAYLFRRTTRNLEKNHIIPIKRDLPRELGHFNETRKVWEFPNGSILHFCYCETDADLDNYQGPEIHWLGVDEAGQFSQFQLVYLRARVRLGSFEPKQPHILPRIVFASNPGGAAHDFLKRVFIDRAPAEALFYDKTTADERKPDDKGMLSIFIPARMDDNKYLDSAYAGQFTLMPEHLKRMFRDGDWDVREGAFFDCWDRAKHVIPTFMPPAHWTKFRSLDWGHATPFSVGWWAISDGKPFRLKNGDEMTLPAGAMVRYREWYGAKVDELTGLPFPNVGLRQDAEDVASGILRRTSERIDYTVADPKMWNVVSGPSPAEKMIRAGLPLIRGDNERVAGWQEMYGRLKAEMMLCTENCSDFIRTVPGVPVSDKNLEDVDTHSEDHVVDESRYAGMSRPWIKHQREKEKTPTGWEWNAIFDRVQNQKSTRVRI